MTKKKGNIYMLYKDFEKELIQICRTISAKHTGKKNSYDNWGQVSKEIQLSLIHI